MHQQTYTPQEQQQRMQQPPTVLTTKDLSYLKDAMSWELLVMKKCNHFAQECKDQQIKQAINRTGKMHEKHYSMLLKHVDPAHTLSRTF